MNRRARVEQSINQAVDGSREMRQAFKVLSLNSHVSYVRSVISSSLVLFVLLAAALKILIDDNRQGETIYYLLCATSLINFTSLVVAAMERSNLLQYLDHLRETIND